MRSANRSAFMTSRLERYKDITVKALLAYLPDREPRRYLYDLVSSYPQGSGKGLRPALCIATCVAFGGTLENVLRSAVAIELFHNAFLIHDDIEDGSEYRRGKPTLAAEQGYAIAVNVGDAMNMLSIRPLMDNFVALGPSLSWQIFAEIEHMVRQSVEGQAMELGWIQDNVCDLTEQDYLRMTLKKSCWYTCIHPCRIGALVGTSGAIDLDRFNRFGYYLGAAFQIQDDVLNLVGSHKTYGKEIGGDIWEGKRTLMLIHTLNNCTIHERERMRAILAKPREEKSAKDVRWVYRIMDKYGSVAFARSSARQLVGAALREFVVAYGELPSSKEKEFIRRIVLQMSERDH